MRTSADDAISGQMGSSPQVGMIMNDWCLKRPPQCIDNMVDNPEATTTIRHCSQSSKCLGIAAMGIYTNKQANPIGIQGA